ncbi:MAG: hypothetical protein EOO90_27030 [Pedobacter sp.]|nr:MAG: hypothetical protein EOO90_27030 [Pedobacter sp.]
MLDADDEWHPKKIEIVNAMIDSKYNLYGHASTLDDFNITSDIENNKASVEITFFDMLIKNRFVTPSVVFYNDQKFLFDEEMHHTEDHDLWLRMTYQKPALYINQKLVKLGRPVLSKGGASSDTWKMRKGELKMYINASKYSTLCKIILPILLPFSIFKFVKKSLIG